VPTPFASETALTGPHFGEQRGWHPRLARRYADDHRWLARLTSTATFCTMSTVAEIEAAIEQLPPADFRALCEWIVRRAEGTTGHRWTPEELGAAAEQMVAEEDPARADALGVCRT